MDTNLRNGLLQAEKDFPVATIPLDLTDLISPWKSSCFTLLKLLTFIPSEASLKMFRCRGKSTWMYFWALISPDGASERPGKRTIHSQYTQHSNRSPLHFQGILIAFWWELADKGGIFLLTFLLLQIKNTGSVFKHALHGPKGESQGWLSYKKVSRHKGETTQFRFPCCPTHLIQKHRNWLSANSHEQREGILKKKTRITQMSAN